MTEKQLDQFYTKDDVAFECLKILKQILKKVETNKSDLFFLEPSAGGGSFVRALRHIKPFKNSKFLAIDLSPHQPYIIQKDFLKGDISNLLPKKNNVITIGNPPFGKRSKLAAEFINTSFLYSNIVAFILPLQFQKYSAQKMIYPYAKLVCDIKLDANSFLFKDKDYSVRCCFQIWTTNNTSLPDLRLRTCPITKHKDFDMYQYNNTEVARKYFNKDLYKWDFAVPRQGFKDYTIKEKDPKKMDKKTQWIFFKAKNEKILNRLLNIDFAKLSHKNTSIPGFGKADVIEEYDSIYGSAVESSTETQTFQFGAPNPSFAGTFPKPLIQ